MDLEEGQEILAFGGGGYVGPGAFERGKEIEGFFEEAEGARGGLP